jgi:hypothetical protein
LRGLLLAAPEAFACGTCPTREKTGFFRLPNFVCMVPTASLITGSCPAGTLQSCENKSLAAPIAVLDWQVRMNSSPVSLCLSGSSITGVHGSSGSLENRPIGHSL